MPKYNILFLTPELPYPPYSGGKIKSWELVKYLSQQHHLSIGSILKGDDNNYLSEFTKKIKHNHFYTAPVNKSRSILNLAKSYLRREPLNIYRTYSKAFKKIIEENIAQYDVVFLDHYEVFQYIPDSYSGGIILHEHNAYYYMWQRYATSGKGLLKRIVAWLEAKRVQPYEKKACDRADIILASPNDIQSLVSIGVQAEKCHETYHLGDENNLNAPDLKFTHTSLSLLYIGTLSWEANKDGLLWFLQEIWPLLHQQEPLLTFNIIGKGADNDLEREVAQYPQVKLLGFIEDLEPFMHNSRIFIAPLRFGAGIKVKVLSAMARGLPIVTTDIGAEGLKIQHKKHLMLANTSHEMITAIQDLLHHPDLWQTLATESRQLVKEKYSWKSVLQGVETTLQIAYANKKSIYHPR